MIVNDLTMAEFEAGLRQTRTAILPVGSVEEHGLHLPLGTDTLQMWEVAVRAAQEVPAFVLPSLHYGYCRSTRDHPGTIGISLETLRRTVFDVAGSAYRQGIRGLIVASGHASALHMAALEEAGEGLVEAWNDLEVAVVCEYLWAREARTIVETIDDGHAGEIETSRVLAVNSRLVKGTSPEEYPRFSKPFIPRNKRAGWLGGVWGDPSKGSRDKGERLYTLSAKRMATLIREMETRIGAR